MRTSTSFTLIVCLALIAGGSISRAEPATSDPTTERKTRGLDTEGHYYGDRERGWFWYEVDPDLPPPPEEQEFAPGQGTPEEAAKPMTVEWLKKEMEEAKIRGINNPTRENVEYYAYLEKIMLDMSEKFALMRQQVTMVNPSLDETIDNPTTMISKRARSEVKNSEQERILSDIAKDVGIYYFFKSDCPYCRKQNIPLREMTKRYGFHVLGVSIDGLPMPDDIIKTWTPDRGQAAKLEVQATPTLYLVKPPNEVVLVTTGVQTLPGLIRRVLQVSHAQGWIEDATFDKAMRGLPRRFFVDALEDEDVDWDDPVAALDAMRRASSRAKASTTIDALGVSQETATMLYGQEGR